uniref:Si:ch211-63o20.7 n=1 Tax=Neolamprologus brichardi TaxID=32507 RepID=A0A3Q4HXT0_NEOBR
MEELYTLEREVGRGSYGVVFEGRVAKTGQKVAIKRLPCSNPECIELYLQELWAMRTTARNHVNVIALHSCLLQTGSRSLKTLKPGNLPLRLVESVLKGSVVTAKQSQESTSPQSNTRRTNSEQAAPLRCLALWLVMEYCDGGDLNQYLLSRPPDAQRNHSVVQQLCGAVAFLHSLGITHRDLKPDNVLVCVTPKGPVVKVADFGLSKMSEGSVDGGLTRQHFSSTCGSDFYMAPEVWGGLTYTAQADIFSLGVMFWAVLERITFLEEGTTQEQLGKRLAERRRHHKPLPHYLPDWLHLMLPHRANQSPPFIM